MLGHRWTATRSLQAPAGRWGHLGVLLVVFGLAGCVIGTWPTPEDQKVPVSTTNCANCSGQGASSEACDGIDNDGDGAVDEGCPCNTGSQRGCIGVSAGRCGLGVQSCVRGRWQGCSDVGPPWTPLQTPSVGTITVTPQALVRDDAGGLTVTVAPEAACPWVYVPQATVVLEASSPVMQVRAIALDDGQGADAVAGDGVLTAHLANPFGPGVPAQDLTLTVEVILDGQTLSVQRSVPLEDP